MDNQNEENYQRDNDSDSWIDISEENDESNYSSDTSTEGDESEEITHVAILGEISVWYEGVHLITKRLKLLLPIAHFMIPSHLYSTVQHLC